MPCLCDNEDKYNDIHCNIGDGKKIVTSVDNKIVDS